MTKLKNKNKIVPIVFAVDNNYAPYLSVTIKSILENSSQDRLYRFFVLNTGISKEYEEKLIASTDEKSSIEFIDVDKRLNAITEKLPLRDYYTNTIYYRLFIPSLFPEYDKILYLDSDIVVLKDICEMFDTDITGKLVGAIREEVMTTVKVFSDYSEECLDVPHGEYFNSGVLLINAKAFREKDVEGQFVSLLKRFKFVVAPDQDYLNVICNKNVHYFDLGWNKMPLKEVDFPTEQLKLVHYKLFYKPWFYKNVMYDEYFWKYAKKSPFYSEIVLVRERYGQEEIARDLIAYKNLMVTAKNFVEMPDNYKKSKCACEK